MFYKVKRTIVSILTSILVIAAYCIYTFSKVQSGAAATDDLKFWATTILVFIGIGIVFMIIIQIVFHILLSIAMAVKEQVQTGSCDDKKIEKTLELDMVEDEMDKLIELKSMRISFIIVGIGFTAALVSLVMNYSPVVMLNIMFASFSIGSLIEGFTQLHFYKAGIKNV
ncbi:MAG: hypothetical protein ACYCYM_12375 [Saccharofermentanales bacterium]